MLPSSEKLLQDPVSRQSTKKLMSAKSAKVGNSVLSGELTV